MITKMQQQQQQQQILAPNSDNTLIEYGNQER